MTADGFTEWELPLQLDLQRPVPDQMLKQMAAS
jgi:hypothetical protein